MALIFMIPGTGCACSEFPAQGRQFTVTGKHYRRNPECGNAKCNLYGLLFKFLRFLLWGDSIGGLKGADFAHTRMPARAAIMPWRGQGGGAASDRKGGAIMFKRKSPPVRIGESFVKAGDPAGIAWRVTRVWTTAMGLPHAQIENNGHRKETRIISVSALTDMHFFGPAPNVAARSA